jgi:hypothetical protein
MKNYFEQYGEAFALPDTIKVRTGCGAVFDTPLVEMPTELLKRLIYENEQEQDCDVNPFETMALLIELDKRT